MAGIGGMVDGFERRGPRDGMMKGEPYPYGDRSPMGDESTEVLEEGCMGYPARYVCGGDNGHYASAVAHLLLCWAPFFASICSIPRVYPALYVHGGNGQCSSADACLLPCLFFCCIELLHLARLLLHGSLSYGTAHCANAQAYSCYAWSLSASICYVLPACRPIAHYPRAVLSCPPCRRDVANGDGSRDRKRPAPPRRDGGKPGKEPAKVCVCGRDT